ncbi:MAG: RHS repeat-associated core domain-containing protein, partial [Prevotella sp.]|nr:RHS repeat-associated core domain-containing protein [Prevotella sp.]
MKKTLSTIITIAFCLNLSGHSSCFIDKSNMIYENNVLKKILIDGGYITFNDTIPEYHYYLKDHLGNNRVVVKIDGTVEQVNHYYPFGGLLGESTGCSVQWYKYNGKEFDRTHGLDWYDYGARFMTPDIGRFTTIDPLAEKYYSISPYVYCVDNPIRNIDPLGDTILVINKCNTFKYENGKLYNKDGNLYKGENGKLKGFLSQVVNALGKISATKTGNNLIHNLSQSEHNYSISKGVNRFVVNSIGRASVKRVAPQYNGPVG